MANRADLDQLLRTITNNVYYQPPVNINMKYPCIRYSKTNITNQHADNMVYKQTIAYEIIVIDRDPDSYIVEAVSKIPGIRFNTHYVSEGLNHDRFTLHWYGNKN